jgi:hypothetical protein
MSCLVAFRGDCGFRGVTVDTRPWVIDSRQSLLFC